MSKPDFDVQQQLQSDVDMVKNLNRKGVSDISLGGVIEYSLWSLSVLSVIGMIGVLPWVGEGKVLTGTVWLGYSLACILLFGCLAGFIRWIRQTGDDLDQGMTRQFDTTRGR